MNRLTITQRYRYLRQDREELYVCGNISLLFCILLILFISYKEWVAAYVTSIFLSVTMYKVCNTNRRARIHISRLPFTQIHLTSDEALIFVCSICLENSTQNVVRLACSHDFHMYCIMPWYEIEMTCPICRNIMN